MAESIEGGVITIIEGVLPSILKQRAKSWQNECAAAEKALYLALRSVGLEYWNN
jgi:hypothetical protein